MLPVAAFLIDMDLKPLWFGFLDHFTAFSAIVAGVFVAWRYFSDRNDARERAADDRFMTATAALASESPRERLAGSVMLRTFLTPSLERFYPIVFDYSVGLLRSRPSAVLQEGGSDAIRRRYEPPSEEEKALLQSLVPALIGAVQLMELQETNKPEYGRDARRIKLDWLFLDHAQLTSVCLEGSSMVSTHIRRSVARSSDLSSVKGHSAYFEEVDLTGSRIWRAEFEGGAFSDCAVNKCYLLGTRLIHHDLVKCEMIECDFEQVHFEGVVIDQCAIRHSSFYLARFNESGFYRSDLRNVDMNGAKVFKDCSIVDCDLTGADLSATVLDRVHLNGSDFTGVNFMVVSSMNDAQMYNVKGVSPETMKYLVDEWGVSTNMDYPSPLQPPPPVAPPQ